MTADAIFLPASATKPVATVALAERKVVDLDAPVTTWPPDFRPRIGGHAPAISLRALLTHTSGLSYPFREPPGSPYHTANVSSGIDQPGLSAAEQLRRLGSVPLLFEPGTKWNYSLGVDVAGLAAAAADGRTFQEIVAALITAPLGMRDTAFAVAAAWPGRRLTCWPSSRRYARGRAYPGARDGEREDQRWPPNRIGRHLRARLELLVRRPRPGRPVPRRRS